MCDADPPIKLIASPLSVNLNILGEGQNLWPSISVVDPLFHRCPTAFLNTLCDSDRRLTVHDGQNIICNVFFLTLAQITFGLIKNPGTAQIRLRTLTMPIFILLSCANRYDCNQTESSNYFSHLCSIKM